MGSNQPPPDLDTVYAAIRTLYSEDQNVPPTEKQNASAWLTELQKSIFAWKIADELLHRHADLHSCYFGAQTLRTKIQNSFMELPPDSHISLRDSLLVHISNIRADTDHIIVTQLCLAVAHLILQSHTWADPIGHILHTQGSNPIHWWPVLEILTLLPEEVHSRRLQLGENRRKEIIGQLELVAPTILSFLKQCLQACTTMPLEDIPKEVVCISIVKCFGSWVIMSPEYFLSDRPLESILGYSIMNLINTKCGIKMHNSASDCLCAIMEILPDLENSNNNNATELENFILSLTQSLLQFEEAYQFSVAEEELDKTQNYAKIFSDYGESMISNMLKVAPEPHFSTQIIPAILKCTSHHDYDIAEITFGFWYRLSEDLYHFHDEHLNGVFKPYALQLIQCLYKHCHIEPDHEGPLTSSDEFYEFRKKAAELFQDVLFLCGVMDCFAQIGSFLKMPDLPWDGKEAALFLLCANSSNIDKSDNTIVLPIVEIVLSWRQSDWPHVALKLAAIKFLGGIAPWLSHHEQYISPTMNFLVESLTFPECSNAAAASLHNLCQTCSNYIAINHFDNLIGLIRQLDQYSVSNDSIIGILKGLGPVMCKLPKDTVSRVIRELCWAQLTPLNALAQNPGEYQRCTKNDPTFWIDRLSALFRNMYIEENELDGNGNHPCKVTICEDMWPIISQILEHFQADVRVMERVVRCIRFAIRCIGKNSHPFLEPLAVQIVRLYGVNRHSCFLYLGSILVDEYGKEPSCTQGLIQMLEAFYPATINIVNEPQGYRNHPDTIDDFFRLCTRYVQRCPIALYNSPVINGILDMSMQGAQLDHREANLSVMKFLTDLVHSAMKNKDLECYTTRLSLARSLFIQRGHSLVSNIVVSVIFILPSYTISDIVDFFYELKEFMQPEFANWILEAMKSLPTRPGSGGPYYTNEQLQEYHHKLTDSSKNTKEMYRALKEFCRLYR